MKYLDWPKIDLHCHLDGSVRPETIRELAIMQGIEIPESLREELVAPETCQSLDEYLLRFDLPNRLMQTQENLERITFELYEDAARENVKYMEVRFGPLLHVMEGLSLDQVFKGVLSGMKRAEKNYDIKGNLIVSILRTMPKDRIYELIDVAAQYLNKGVVAMDLAASELPGFCQEFIPHMAYAREKGFHITIHAGETGSGQNVTDAIQLLGAERIGHGIYIHDDQEAFDLCLNKQTVLEVCPTSNVQTKAVPTLVEHPMKMFYDKEIKVTINTDNRTVSDTTMTKELEKTFETFEMTVEDYKQIYLNSICRAFTNESTKEWLRDYLKDII